MSFPLVLIRGRSHRRGQLTKFMKTEKCPFKVGQTVVYRPSNRGKGLDVMTDFARLKTGERYKIARIDRDVYLVIEGFENATGGGLYWTEFSAK